MREIKRLDEKYAPEKISSGNELYSGSVDARSFRMGFNQAKAMLLSEFKSLLLRERIDELKRLRDMPEHEMESYGNEIEDRISELSRLSGEESHE